MKIPVPIIPIEVGGAPFALFVSTASKRLVENGREARLLLAYARQLIQYIKGQHVGTVVHRAEEMLRMNASDMVALRHEHRKVMDAIYSWQRRTGIMITETHRPFRNIRRKDDKYFDVKEYKREMIG